MKNILIFLTAFALLSGCTPSPKAIEEAIAKTQEALPTSTITLTPLPTNTPKPTATPKPTNTPRPTNTSTPKPEPKYYEGTGDKVLELDIAWNGPSILEISNSGRSNFIVYNYDSQGNKIDLLVNEIGAYHGKKLIDVLEGDYSERLEVKSSGAWKITVYPFVIDYLEVLNLPGQYEGDGDNIIVINGTPDIGTFSTTESTNFVVWTYYSNSRELLVNEIGPYSGESIIPLDTVFLVVECNGKWNMDITAR